jgi:hypothetical protein
MGGPIDESMVTSIRYTASSLTTSIESDTSASASIVASAAALVSPPQAGQKMHALRKRRNWRGRDTRDARGLIELAPHIIVF